MGKKQRILNSRVKNKCKKMAVPKPKIGSYPLALLPGQFCDYYAT